MFCLPVCVVHYGHGIAIPNWLPCGLPVKYAVKYALGAPEEKEDKDKESVSDSSATGCVLQALNCLKQPCGQPACQPTQGLYHQHGQPKVFNYLTHVSGRMHLLQRLGHTKGSRKRGSLR
jgi:hypothetical protein